MKRERILIVEDEKKIADILQFGLSENGFSADVAYDGGRGYALFKEQQYDLVILDINLPGMNGYELCRRIRSLNLNIPIIFLTSLIELNDKIVGYNQGADDFLVKPFEFKELLFKIRVFLKRGLSNRSLETKILKAGELEMDLGNNTVRIGTHEISLTSKEFQLLEYLIKHQNQVVTRNDIALHVWENDFDTKTNVIDVYINYLRNKIAKYSNNKLIYTIIGRGYMLKDKTANVSSE